MKSRTTLIFVVGATLAASQLTAIAALPERSVSTSRQFIVYGADARLRGGICDLAERTKRDALRLLRQSDGWQTPIVVHAQPPQANLPEAARARLDFSQTGSGLKIQLNLILGDAFDASEAAREILRAVFLERMYRDQPETPAGTPYVEPPDWLLDGVLALAHEIDSAVTIDEMSRALAADRPPGFRVFLQQQPKLLESPLRVLYRAYAAAAFSMLIDSPGGARRLQRFLADLPAASPDSVAELRKHFPELGSTAEELEKSWSEAVKRFSRRERYRMLGCEETERQLAQILRVEVPRAGQQPSVYGLEDFEKFLPLPGAGPGLKRLNDDLLLLSCRANALYRPVIAEYQQIATLLTRKKMKRLPERLAELRETREQISRRMTAIEDYMNWFEATQARAMSGAFGEYMKAAELAAQRERRRRDPISAYLDSFEAHH